VLNSFRFLRVQGTIAIVSSPFLPKHDFESFQFQTRIFRLGNEQIACQMKKTEKPKKKSFLKRAEESEQAFSTVKMAFFLCGTGGFTQLGH